MGEKLTGFIISLVAWPIFVGFIGFLAAATKYFFMIGWNIWSSN